MFLRFCIVLIFFINGSVVADILKQSDYISINNKNQKLENDFLKYSKKSRANTVYATIEPPVYANQDIIARYQESGTIFLWQNMSGSYMRIEPETKKGIFVCGSQFHIIQDGVQYDTVKLILAENGDAFCDTLTLPQTFKITNWEHMNPKFNEISEFEIVHEGYYNDEFANKTFVLGYENDQSGNTLKYTIPYLNVSTAYTTFIKVFNNSECTLNTKFAVFGDNGQHNDDNDLIDLDTNLLPKHSKVFWAKDLRSKAALKNIDVSNSFGAELYFHCNNNSLIKPENITTVVVQKSPEGQRVMPVYKNNDKLRGPGTLVASYVNQDPRYITFIKLLNTGEDQQIVVSGFPDATGIEYKTTINLPAKRVTLFWANELASMLKFPGKVSSFAVMFHIGTAIEKVYPVMVQKTTDGPRVISVEKF